MNPRVESNAFPTFPTIAAAVINADAGDTIYVAPGVYYEDVIIGKQLSLVGAGSDKSIINAPANELVPQSASLLSACLCGGNSATDL